MTTAGNVLRGSILRVFDMLVLMGATFLVTPFLVRALGDRLYGFWTLTGAIVGYYGFLDLGLSAAATRYMSQALGKGDEEELNRVASTAHGLFIATAVVVTGATLASAAACPLLLRDPGEAALVQKLIVIMGTAAAVGFPVKIYSGMLMAGIRYDLFAAVSIARNLFYYAAIYLSLRSGHGLVAVALVSFAAAVLERAALRAACKARFPRLKISLSRFERKKVSAMFDYGSKILVCQIGDILRFRLDSVVIAGFLGANMVTPYAIAVRLVEGFTKVVQSFTGTMLPVFSQYQGRGDDEGIRVALLKGTKIASMLSAFIGLSVIFYGGAFIQRWMGPGYETSYAVVVVLCAANILGMPHSPGINLLYGLSKHKFYAVLSVCEGLANVALSVFLLQRFGVLGVALGTLAEICLFKLLIQPVYVCRVAGLPLRTYLIDTMAATLIKTSAPLVVYFAAVYRFVAPDYAVLTACVALQTLLFVPAAYFFILDGEERLAVAKAAREAISRRRPVLAASAKG